MQEPTIEIIVAVDSQGGFGKDGKIPWTCKRDMKRFTEISKTIGVCVMGKHTYQDMLDMQMQKEGAREKIIEKGILPGRKSFVVSSTLAQEDVIGATVVPDLRAVLNEFQNTNQRIAVIGGEKLYVQALGSAKRVHMTVIPQVFNCDRFFPVNDVKDHFTINKKKSESVQVDVNESKETVYFVQYVRN